MSVKQDRQGARTLADLERKYNFGRNFAEVIGIATDARNAATKLDEKLTKEIEEVKKEIKQTDSGLMLKVEAEYTKKTTFAEFANLVSAQLEMKIGTDESGKLISMINASADIINLNSNRLVIDSDYFKLSYNGVASINSAQIDYARMVGARIGSAYFSDNGDFATPQINFLREGIYLSEHANTPSNRHCLVWENTDGTNIFRLRGDGNGLHIEGVEYADSVLDLTIFGMSIREMYNKLQELTGHTHSYTKTSTTASCTSRGEATYTCTCGDTYTEVEEATGHSYVDGYCEYCGEANPDYEEPSECPHTNTTEGGNVIDSCHSEAWVECLDCGMIINSWTETHHSGDTSAGTCSACGEPV